MTGGKSKTIVNVSERGQNARIDVEFPESAKSSGEVHIQVKGKGIGKGGLKVRLDSVSGLNNKKIPKHFRNNATLKRAAQKGLELLENSKK